MARATELARAEKSNPLNHSWKYKLKLSSCFGVTVLPSWHFPIGPFLGSKAVCSMGDIAFTVKKLAARYCLHTTCPAQMHMYLFHARDFKCRNSSCCFCRIGNLRIGQHVDLSSSEKKNVAIGDCAILRLARWSSRFWSTCIGGCGGSHHGHLCHEASKWSYAVPHLVELVSTFGWNSQSVWYPFSRCHTYPILGHFRFRPEGAGNSRFESFCELKMRAGIGVDLLILAKFGFGSDAGNRSYCSNQGDLKISTCRLKCQYA